ncbi:hypothetical protein PAXRUDRAFT_33852 [Paxillus rubicundulus Ve08.2h10]|uniref:Uncharacterized protein n=1 Tax=Paxillus rubicundulus Ve08.2h10 TaxID=930991 RepID=A0A0D0E794_9AGAM|nr:hypothetical protein PAXRUDRAFT_33852 [Paxillus rubicundulus Ve08.2h10]
MLFNGHSINALTNLDDDEPHTNIQVQLQAQVSAKEAEIDKLQLDAIKERCQALEEENCILQANKPRKSAKGTTPNSLTVYDIEIHSLAKKFGVMGEMFFPGTQLLSCTPNQVGPYPLPTDATHYSASQCTEEEVASEIFDLPAWYFTSKFQGQLQVPEICTMLGVDVNNPRYGIWPPIFFAGGVVNMPRPFSNWKILAQTNATLWSAVSCTPGHILWASVATIFTLSVDSELSKSGTGITSQILYHCMFCKYKCSLIKQWDTPAIQEVVQEINQYVFGHPNTTSKAKSTTMLHEDLTVEVDAAMAAMILPLNKSEQEPAAPHGHGRGRGKQGGRVTSNSAANTCSPQSAAK